MKYLYEMTTELNLTYLDKDNEINIRDLNTDKDTYNSDIKTQLDLIEEFYKNGENKYELIYNNFDVLKTDEWFNSVDKEGIGEDFDIDSIKSCTNENYKENNNCRSYIIGYKIIFDKDGKYLSKENFLGICGI